MITSAKWSSPQQAFRQGQGDAQRSEEGEGAANEQEEGQGERGGPGIC